MNIEARKISVVKELLSVENEGVVKAVEDLLRKIKIENYENNLTPMSMARYRAEIQMAIEDEKNGRLIRAVDLKKKIREWD